MAGRILVVDDEKDMLALLSRIITGETEHEVVTTPDPVQALALFREKPFDLVITDLKMPKMDGIALLERIKNLRPEASVVILTAHATIENAIEAIRKGAYDYLTKPFRRERILLTVDKVIKWQEMVRENLSLREALADKGRMPYMVGDTPVMRRLFEEIKKVAPTMATVLITGPSGTGKELVARAIHSYSTRREKDLVTVNCTAIPENLLESELFGHIKGAFTGAWKDQGGQVEQAHEGTLFLDEIGDISPLMQTKLLRLIQEGEYKPVGGQTTKRADIRFIAATNHNLKNAIKEKTFREDLYYRLNVIHFDLPPLKARKDDIPLLSHHFIKKYAQLNAKDIRNISPQAMTALMSHDFPGNVRELENIIERAVIYCSSDTLRRRDLLLEDEHGIPVPEISKEGANPLSFKECKEKMISNFHAQYVRTLLAESGGNVSRAAQIAGIQRQYLHRLMKESGIEAEDFKKGGFDAVEEPKNGKEKS